MMKTSRSRKYNRKKPKGIDIYASDYGMPQYPGRIYYQGWEDHGQAIERQRISVRELITQAAQHIPDRAIAGEQADRVRLEVEGQIRAIVEHFSQDATYNRVPQGAPEWGHGGVQRGPDPDIARLAEEAADRRMQIERERTRVRLAVQMARGDGPAVSQEGQVGRARCHEYAEIS